MDISTILYYKKLMKIVLYNRIRYPIIYRILVYQDY